MTGLQRYRPVVLTQQAQNLDTFPLETVHDASRRGLVPRLLNRAYRKITGEYAFYQPLLQRERACLIHAHFGFEGSRCLGAQRRSRLPLLTTFYGADASSYAGHPYWRRRYRQLFDAGAGFIGFSLLAAGVCETLALVEVNPAAVAAARPSHALAPSRASATATSSRERIVY